MSWPQWIAIAVWVLAAISNIAKINGKVPNEPLSKVMLTARIFTVPLFWGALLTWGGFFPWAQ